jgi:hypothetical protein
MGCHAEDVEWTNRRRRARSGIEGNAIIVLRKLVCPFRGFLMNEPTNGLVDCPFCGDSVSMVRYGLEDGQRKMAINCGGVCRGMFIFPNVKSGDWDGLRSIWNARAPQPVAPTLREGHDMSGDFAWRRIESAPKDGSYVVVLYQSLGGPHEYWHGRSFVARYEGKTADGYDLGWNLFPGYGGVPDMSLSYWMPLPPPPPEVTP